jgi:hypothetical protein
MLKQKLNINDYTVKQTFKKFKRSRQANALFFSKSLLEMFFFYCYESKNLVANEIREMVATGFGRFLTSP